MDKYKFGEFIYQKRKSLGLTQDELGKRLGVTNKAVSKWETGETLPEIIMLKQLATTLNISVDELLNQKDNNEISVKNTKINSFLIAGLVVLFLALIITICLFTIKGNDIVVLDNTNLSSYIEFDPLYSFDSENQKLVITSSYILDKNFEVKETITLNISYTINFFYYKEDGKIGTVSYFNREVLVTIEDNQLVFSVLSLEPKDEILFFVGLKSVNVKYEINESNGQLLRR